ncbi:MAG TPA: ABC transporter [Caulobacteraceae bacterium]|nr:ABC transporter [Caulobacteraceae bacterium]
MLLQVAMSGLTNLFRPSATPAEAWRGVREHANIIWALMLRELATRYGRNNAGFLWIAGEPLVFCAGAFTMWSLIRPPYEHGIRLLPFVMTGYLPLTLVRHMLSHGVVAVRANAGLLYHRRVTVLHLFTSRLALEFVGVSLAFVCVFVVLWTYGQVLPPPDLGRVYGGWFLLGWLSFGLGLIYGAIGTIFEVFDRFIAVLSYVMIPIIGTFYMAAWLPPKFRDALLVLPFIHTSEMIRAGFFGEFVRTYYNPPYVIAWAVCLTFVGLVIMRYVRERVEIE